MDEYYYIVKVYATNETRVHQHKTFPQAFEHYNTELLSGNNADLFRNKDGKLERYNKDIACSCAKCAHKKIAYKPRMIN